MPSAKKNEKTKSASVTAAARRSGGKSVAKTASAASSRTSGAAKTSDSKKSAAKSTATVRTAAAAAKTAAVKTSAAKAAPAAKTAAKTEAKSAGASKSARAASAVKNSSARKGPVVEPTTASRPVEKAAAKSSAAKPVAAKPVAAKATTAKPVAAAVKPAAAKVSADKSTSPATAKRAPEKAAAQTPAAPKAPAAKKVETAVKPSAPAIVKTTPAKAVEAVTAAAPAAPRVAPEAVRGATSPFPAAASASSGKSSSTPTAGEDKKLAKRSEHPVPTPVVAEKTSIEIKAAPKAAAPVKAKPAGAKHGFKLNEHIVYPAHGVGQIIGVETQEVAGFSLELFVVSFIKDKMILKVPTSKVTNVGMRKLAETHVVEKALGTLSGRARIKRTMWSRRAQEYEAKITSGDLVTIAEVVRDLYRSDTQPEQSYSERQLYEAALDRMAREVAAVRKRIDSEALKLIESFLQKGPRRGAKADAEADVAEVDEVVDEEDVDRAA
jgi:CarD family transcriptional regulator